MNLGTRLVPIFSGDCPHQVAAPVQTLGTLLHVDSAAFEAFEVGYA